MRKFCILFLFLAILSFDFVYAYLLPGSEYFNSHVFAHDQAIGGSASANTETASSILINPSTGAFLKQIAITTSLGGFTSIGTYGLFGVSYPTVIGTFSGQFLYYGIPFSGIFGGTVAFSKDVADNLGVGFGITATSGVSIGLNLGFVYKVSEDLNQGLGIKKLVWGASILNLGLPAIVSNYDPFPSLPNIRSGVDLMFLRTDPVKFNFTGDIVLGAWGLNAEINGGLTVNVLDLVLLKGGGFWGINRYGYGFGATLKYTLERQWGIERLDIRLHYSYNNIIYSSSGISGSGHWVGFDFALGTIDTTPPKINIDVEVSENSNSQIDLDLSGYIKFLYFSQYFEKVTYVSPNYDGRKDRVKVNLNISESGILKEWKLIVKDAKGSEVKVISSKIRREFSLDLEELFNRLFAPKRSVDVPREIYWDGTDSKGKVVPDGEYFVQVYAKDFEGNEAYSPILKVIVDNTPPSGNISVPYYIFSPNGDGNKDDITFTLKGLTKGDEWIAYIEDISGNISKTWNLGTDPVDVITWGGLGDDGKLLPDGNYNFVLKAEDKAGNVFVTNIKGIIISTKLRNLFVKSDIYEFSPNNDGHFDKANISIIIDDTNGLQKLNVYIKDTRTDKVIRQWNFEGSKILTDVYWDGTDNTGNVINDDIYVVYADADYIDGNKPVSPPIQIKIDATPPQVKVSFSPSLFSPDDDGVNDEVTFNFNVSDDSEIDEWFFKILTPDGKRTFKEFKGKGSVPTEIAWNGVGDKGDTVDSAEEYPLVFEIRDKLGNKNVVKPAVLPTDILVEVTPYGYKIRVHSIEFAFGSAEVTPKGLSIIKRVGDKLRKFSGYRIRVEGHTDNVGSYDYNLKLSKSRAESVMKELIKLGIDKNRISAEGFSFDRPIAPNDTEEGRAKNRRVEFLLIRD